MNLRDKLRAVDSGRKKAAQQDGPVFTDCWQRTTVRPAEAFPGAWESDREALMLMQGEEMPDPVDPARILYLDTETTGLAGGAGTVAFEVGLGRLTADGFRVTQLIMRDYPEERFLLRRVAEALADADVLCTFNGKTFDVPLLRDRFLMNRMDPDCLELPHIDLLHIVRRVWKLRLRRCSLAAMEEAVLGCPRTDDLPGSEAPKRYFDFLKTGRFELLEDVLRHNEQDIASLCVLLNHMTRLYRHPEELTFGEDVYAMGVALDRMKHPEEARRCYRLVPSGRMHASGQLRLAENLRRAGSRDGARDVWQGMVDRREGGAAPYIALAKHAEHVDRDIDAALEYTRRALMLLAEPRLGEDRAVQETRNALQYRYDRLKRKQVRKGL